MAAGVESGAGEVCGAGLAAAPDGATVSAGCGAGRGDSAGVARVDCGAKGQSCTVAGAWSARGASADGSAGPGLEFNPMTVGDDRGVSLAKRLAGAFAAAMGVEGRAADNGVDFVGARLPAAARAVSTDGGAAFGLTLETGGRDTGLGGGLG